MTSLKQLKANRRNALKSTGPKTANGKSRSRCNAIRHGLTAETIIGALEKATDYQAFESDIASDYRPRTATERELVSRLASVLWRLRRSTRIETGMLQIQGELILEQAAHGRRRTNSFHHEFDVGPQVADEPKLSEGNDDQAGVSKILACCFLRTSQLQFSAFELLTRYETALWRQAAQILILLQRMARR